MLFGKTLFSNRSAIVRAPRVFSSLIRRVNSIYVFAGKKEERWSSTFGTTSFRISDTGQWRSYALFGNNDPSNTGDYRTFWTVRAYRFSLATKPIVFLLRPRRWLSNAIPVEYTHDRSSEYRPNNMPEVNTVRNTVGTRNRGRYVRL